MNKLRGRIIEKYGNYKKFSEVCGIPQFQFYNKLHGTRPFSEAQKDRIAELLGEERRELFNEQDRTVKNSGE